ncbi:sulfatase [Flavicella sp.]|uniref:sulfatase n=1 Tax=Flavicella sp. TaxID=2957742 RepID=UPI00261CF3AC|nr:sulfatase [Flavicella sp.]MDG1806155.1 sulfatase [Flavicella sp.]
MMKKVVYTILLSMLLLACEKEEKNDDKRPNVLFILVDDFGVNDTSFSGSKFYETPHIDSLAAQSTVFTQGYANCRVCSPSRASIMTGQSTARHGVTDWIGAKSGKQWRDLKRHDKLLPAAYKKELPSKNIVLPEAFQNEGYTTFFAGKWHLGGEGSLPENHGFDLNKGGYHKGSPAGGYFSPFKNPKLKDKVKGENLSMRLAEETVSFIKEHQKEPFFAFLSFYAVHGPIQTTKENRLKYRNKAIELGLADEGYEMERVLPVRVTQDNPIYAGLVESMDAAVGKVLQLLKELGLEDNTIVVFTSDNGGVASGDAFSTSNLPLRGGKGYQWEGGIREPYLVKVPWIANPIQTIDAPVTGADLYPTLLDLTGLKLLPSEHRDGMSLKPLLDGKQLKERPLYWHYPHYGNQGGEPSSIIRLGKWKLIHYYEDSRNELYDLENDINERNDLSVQLKDRTGIMHTLLKSYLREVDAKYPAVDSTYSKGMADKLRASKKTQYKVILEKYRKKMLKENFEPNKDWWGSQLTKD